MILVLIGFVVLCFALLILAIFVLIAGPETFEAIDEIIARKIRGDDQ